MQRREKSRPVLRGPAGTGAAPPADDDDAGVAVAGKADDVGGGISCVGSTAAAADRRDEDTGVIDWPSPPPFSRLPITGRPTTHIRPHVHEHTLQVE